MHPGYQEASGYIREIPNLHDLMFWRLQPEKLVDRSPGTLGSESAPSGNEVRLIDAITCEASTLPTTQVVGWRPDQILADIGFSLQPRLSSETLRRVHWRLDCRTLNRLTLASRFLNKNSTCIEDFSLPYLPYAIAGKVHGQFSGTPVWDFPGSKLERLGVTIEASNLPDHGLLASSSPMVVVVATSIYGAISVAAWNIYFRTRVEKILWRSSSLYVVGALLIQLGLWIFVTLLRSRPGISKRLFNKHFGTDIEKIRHGREEWENVLEQK